MTPGKRPSTNQDTSIQSTTGASGWPTDCNQAVYAFEVQKFSSLGHNGLIRVREPPGDRPFLEMVNGQQVDSTVRLLTQ